MRRFIGVASLLVVFVGACNRPESTNTGNGVVSVSLHVLDATPTALRAADACGNTLDSAQIVIRNLDLELSGEGEDEQESGPYLIDLAGADLTGSLQTDFAEIEIPRGTYDQLKFKIHKLEADDPDDEAAAGANPALAELLDAGQSVRIEGTNSDAGAFTFESDLNEEVEREAGVVVGDSASGIDGLTLTIDPSGWFGTAGDCVDPTSEESESAIEENIKTSIDGAEDDDRDGEDDAEEEEGGEEEGEIE